MFLFTACDVRAGEEALLDYGQVRCKDPIICSSSHLHLVGPGQSIMTDMPSHNLPHVTHQHALYTDKKMCHVMHLMILAVRSVLGRYSSFYKLVS